MADDIKKKITIEVELETEDLTKNITNLNSLIDGFLTKQKSLTEGSKQNSEAFKEVASKLEEFQKKLKETDEQLSKNTTSLNALNQAAKTVDGTLSSLSASHQKNTKSAGDSAAKTKELSQKLTELGSSAKQQAGSIDKGKSALDRYTGALDKGLNSTSQLKSVISDTGTDLKEAAGKVDQSKSSFDAHKKTMEHLKKSFDEVKDVSGTFGPSLKDAADGFNVMKSGLKVVQDGLTGVGTAIKADGFEFLLQILQYMFDAFIKTSEGSKELKGAISAVGVIVKNLDDFFASLAKTIIDAVTHPVETIKKLGNAVEQNITNRFKALGVILDGIIHLDFKKVANGVLQATTGVTNVLDKTVKAFDDAKKMAKEVGKEIADAYDKGVAGPPVVKKKKAHSGKSKTPVAGNTSQRAEDLGPAQSAGIIADDSPDNSSKLPGAEIIDKTQQTEAAVVKIKKTALQQIEDYAKQSGVKIANDALNMLSNSIKQQADAKVAALEKEKNAELTNKNLTSAQKLAIQQKYQQQENQVKVKAFKEEKEISIVQAIINGAQAITKVSAQSGVLAPLEIGVVIAETAAQVAKISAQKPPAYARGGLHYNSDGRGGVLPGYSRTDNTNAYLRSGEGVVVSEAMRTPWARNLVSAINVGFGGRDFSITNPGRGYAVGGIFTDGGDANRYYNQPVNDQKNLANSIAYQMINNFPPVYVDVKDVNNQQNILAQTINRVNL